MTEDEFWSSTFRQIQRLNKLWVQKQREKQEDQLTLAYLTANFSRAKKMPDLNTLLRRIRTGNAPPTDEQVEDTKRQTAELVELKRQYDEHKAKKAAQGIR